MKKLIVSAVLLLLLCVPATAGEHEGGPAWSGPYAGAQLGGFFGDIDLTGNMITNAESDNLNGFIGGALAGYSFRRGNLVFGPEADIGWTNADGKGTSAPPPTGGTPPPAAAGDRYKYDVGLVAHGRLRAGVLVTPELLIFAAGGLAFADVDVTETGIGGSSSVTGGNYFGWTIGGGIERMFGERFSGRVEYLYDDFGSRSKFDGVESYKARINAHIVRAALNIHLN